MAMSTVLPILRTTSTATSTLNGWYRDRSALLQTWGTKFQSNYPGYSCINRRSSLSSNPIIAGHRRSSAYGRKIINQYVSDIQSSEGVWIPGTIREYWDADASLLTISNLELILTFAYPQWATVRQSSVNSALVALKNSKVSLGESLAESNKTIRMLADTALTFAKTLVYARKGQWSKLRKLLRDNGKPVPGRLANTWLAFQYGWRPLLSDLYGLHQTVKAGLVSNDQILRVRGASKGETSLTFTFGTVKRTFPVQLGSRTVIYAKVSNSDIARLNQFGLADPASIAWEVVPFSFVVDWFVPIGSFLAALGATRGLTFVDGCRTDHLTIDHTDYYVPQKSYISVIRSGKVTVRTEGVAMERVLLTGFPPAMPVISLRPLTSTRSVSATALIAQHLDFLSRNRAYR